MASATTDRRLGLTSDKGIKAPVTAVATTNITLSGEQTIDGYACRSVNAAGYADRVLCTAQTNPIENGPWDVSTASWTRSVDGNGSADFSKGTLFVAAEGTQAGLFYRVTSNNPVLPGTNAISIGLVTGASAQSLAAQLADPTSTANGDALSAVKVTATGSVATTQHEVNERYLNIFDFLSVAQRADVIAYGYTLDITTPFNVAISAALVSKQPLWMPAGGYLVTTTINYPIGAQIIGVNLDAYNAGFSVAPKGTSIKFAPVAANSDLFVANGTAVSTFRFHNGISGIYMVGNANSRYAINLDHVIYANFSHISAEGFDSPIYCNGTIDCGFSDMYLLGRVAAHTYAGNNETTDLWTHVRFFGSPKGGTYAGSSIGIRYTDCLWEQIDTYGLEIAKDCQAITVVNSYCEDVPYTNTATAAMFKVGFNGTTLSSEYQLVVIGGKYAGRNAGTVGSFLDCDYTNGVMLIGVTHSRFTNIIKTSANTRINSISISCGSGVGWTNYATDFTKVTGVFPNGVNNSGTQAQTARFLDTQTNTLTAADGNGSSLTLTGAVIQFTPGAGNAAYPSADNTADFGLDSNRWKSLRGGYLRTSAAAVAGTGGTFTMGGTTAATVGAAGAATALPANPLGYLICYAGGTQVKIPYYTA